MSNLNGESLHDFINSETKFYRKKLYRSTEDLERGYCQGILDILSTLKQKLITRQVDPYGDRNPLSD